MSEAWRRGGGGSVAGHVALPRPEGDPEGLRRTATALARVAHRALTTRTVRGTLAPDLAAIWSGPAAGAAAEEAIELGRRARRAVSGLPTADVCLRRYADALDRARFSVKCLQQQWDRSLELRDGQLWQIRSVHPDGPARTALVARVEQDHAVEKSRLSRLYQEVLDGLGRAEAAAAAALRAIERPGVARAAGGRLAASDVRSAILAGLPFAEGAERAAAQRALGLEAAAAWRRMGTHPQAELVSAWVAQYGSTLGDSTFAQTFVEEVGVGRLMNVVTEQSAGDTNIDTLRVLLGNVGTALYSAAQVTPDEGVDAATARRLASGAAFAREDLVAALATVQASADGRTRQAGYWLAGQLLTAARQSGWQGRLPSGTVERLLGAAAAAELAETRDNDIERQHGTTQRRGGHLFASLLEDPDRSGDAIRAFLAEVGDDPRDQAAALLTPVDQGYLANSRGDGLVVGEYLVRRWITYENNSSATTEDLHLATNADLERLMASVGALTTTQSAELRARVMVEVNRTNAHARHEFSTIQQYAANTAPIESAAVEWVSEMRASIDRTVAAPSEAVTGYVRSPGDAPEPWLSPGELAALVGAFATATDFTRGAKDPAANHQRLMDAELTRLRERAASGTASAADVARLGFFDASGAGALIALAQTQDAANKRMWQDLAEAKNIAAGLVTGATAVNVVGVVTSGTTRTAADDAVIEIVASDITLEQAKRNEARTAALEARLTRLFAEPCISIPVVSVLVNGAAAAPHVLTSAEEVRLRADASFDAAYAATEEKADARLQSRAQLALPPRLARPDGGSTVPGPDQSTADRGRITKPDGHAVLPGEDATAEKLASHGHDVQFRIATGVGRTSDAFIDGVEWEFKAVMGNGTRTIVDALRKGRGQSTRFVVDLQGEMSLDEALRQVEKTIRQHQGFEEIWLLTRDGQLIKRKA